VLEVVGGVLSIGSPVAPIRGAAQGEFAGTTRIASAAPEFFLPEATVLLLPYAVAVGDLIQFPARAGAPAYAVASIQQSELGGLNLLLVSEDQPE
jgi:hypothetical protein